MPDPENESELARLQRRFEELLAEAERLAEIIRQAEQDLPRLEAEVDPRREILRPSALDGVPSSGLKRLDGERK